MWQDHGILVYLACLFVACEAPAQQDGQLDLTFNPGAGVGGIGSGYYIASVALCTNGQIIVGGLFNSIAGQPRNNVARLNPDGSLDGSFLPGQGPDEPVSAVEVDASGNVFIGGIFQSVNGVGRQGLARLRGDGSLDLSWLSFPFTQVNIIRRQADGAILTSGMVGNTNTMMRLNADGSVDATFHPAARITDGGISDFAVQPDGNIILAGSFTTNSPVSRQCIARVTPAGFLDPSFDAGYIVGIAAGFSGSIDAVALQPDGRIIVAGRFESINGYSRFGLARLNTNGAVDTSFVGNHDARGYANAMLLTKNQKLLLASSTLWRINSDGSMDSTFAPTVVGSIHAMVVQPDGKILIGGSFGAVNKATMGGIARLNGSSTNIVQPQFLSMDRYPGMVLEGTPGNTYRVEWTTDLNSPALWTPLSIVTLQTSPQLVFDPTPMTINQRFYRAVQLP